MDDFFIRTESHSDRLFIANIRQYFFEEKNASANVEVVKNSIEIKSADDVVSKIKETNTHLKTLSLDANPVKRIDIIEKALQVKNSFIHISEIQYLETKTGSSTLSFKGVADKRDSLREFVTKLESIKGFSKIELPVSNFAKDKDIDFSVNISIL